MSVAALKVVTPTLSPTYNVGLTDGTGYHHRNNGEVKVGFKVNNYSSGTVYGAQPKNVEDPLVAQSFINDVFNVCNMFMLDASDVKTIQRVARIVASSPKFQ
ncbi:hypothetical protein OAF54_03280 [bacterium]|nr:hypothetical protein [bacterium]